MKINAIIIKIGGISGSRVTIQRFIKREFGHDRFCDMFYFRGLAQQTDTLSCKEVSVLDDAMAILEENAGFEIINDKKRGNTLIAGLKTYAEIEFEGGKISKIISKKFPIERQN